MLFFIELAVLFFLSQQLTKSLSLFLHRKTKSIKFSIFFISLVFLPGTIIHELSHAIMAGILQVPVGQIEFLPVLSGNMLRMGSVQVGQTDPVRRFFIGTAPFFIGTTLLIALLWMAFQHQLFSSIPFSILILYGVFVLSNTMFSSKKDMEGAIEFFIFVGIIFGVLYFLGAPFFELLDRMFQNSSFQDVLDLGSKFLLIPIGIDIIAIVLLRVFR